MKLAQAIEHYLSYLKNEVHYSSNTYTHYAIDLRQFSAFLEKSGLKNCSLNQITPKDIRNALFALETLQPSSRSRKLSAIRSFFDFCFRRNFIPTHIAQQVVHPKKPKLLPKPVRMEQIFEFLNKTPDWTHYKEARNYMVFAMLFGCGLRISELCCLKISYIRADHQWIRVIGKGNKERDIPLPSRLQDYLHRYLPLRMTQSPHNPYLFPGSKQKAMTPRTVERIIEHIALGSAQAHERFSPHQLRHSFASHLLTSGANLKGIQELLGHEHLTSTEIYTHIHTQRLMDVMEKYHPAGQSQVKGKVKLFKKKPEESSSK